jgi:hypothetical protein
MLKFFWHCLDKSEEDEKFILNSLNELSDLLKKPPVKIELKAMSLPAKIVQIVESELQKPPQQTKEPFRTYWVTINKKLSLPEWSPLMVYCKPNSELAMAARKQCPTAVWGCTVDGILSAVYKLGNKYILWHEILHLFGVDDCYLPNNPHTGPTCELPNCIMQYAPSGETVGEWPFLCQENIKRIKARDERLHTFKWTV